MKRNAALIISALLVYHAVVAIAGADTERPRLSREALVGAQVMEAESMILAWSAEGRDAAQGLIDIALDQRRTEFERWKAVHYLEVLSPEAARSWLVANLSLRVLDPLAPWPDPIVPARPCADTLARRGWPSIEVLVRACEAEVRPAEWKELAAKVIKHLAGEKAGDAIRAVERKSTGLAELVGK